MAVDSFYSMVLATSLNADGHENFDIIKYENEGTASGMGSLLEQYEYVMHGKIFKYQHDENKDVITVFMSFGGLLMSIKGEFKSLKNLEIDSRIYLLLRKI
mmetsp:Transcript_25299/g.17883  ORF Transcript_25299/g.17883 Transcript_25299/m.17883 type:complete len:101 (-) Transcript_25299:85-387(-)|eukprot:CAMPEP_0116881316 /NCGR_PEP_ID=MMETSP0463-20121206/13448_1 /TAXON_ID=181622 /ORGANISM="Strombidinopsis sp, Strain SopsisLIS2011" /LENGTH=100 /DNA_ID=CAMNT_0004533179 /DNA_START=166 /DNA_END=468 /DNA_ORIENTATION=-